MRYELSGHAVGDRGPAAPEARNGGAGKDRPRPAGLEEDPFRPRPTADIRVLEGTDPKKYRLRIGNYRAVYAVVGSEVKVLEVFARGRGYR